VFRFANVVGANMTHGVTHDFIRRLHSDPTRLMIYGDGQQQKPYIHTDDIVAALFLLLRQTSGYNVYNVGSDDQLRVAEIADIVLGVMRLSDVVLNYTGGRRGWLADVPVYSLDTRKIRALGWANAMNSRQAVTRATQTMVDELGRR
jgi:UDP-glucose 4-epimerase